MILVSSPWHIQRCFTEALKVAHQMRIAGDTVPELLAIASHGDVEGLVVLEPPHRGDMPKTKWHTLMRRLFKIPADKLPEAENAFETVFESFGA